MSDVVRIKASVVLDELSDLVDDHRTEGAQFVRDRVGRWFVQTNTNHRQYTNKIWWGVPGDVGTQLDALLEEARVIGNEP